MHLPRRLGTVFTLFALGAAPLGALAFGCAPSLSSGDDRAPWRRTPDPGAVEAGAMPPAVDAGAGEDASLADAARDASGVASDASPPADASPEASPAPATGCTRHRAYVAGDIDGDGRGDIALTGGKVPNGFGPWATIPVAFSRGDGRFTVTNATVGDFPSFTTQGPAVVGGDTNGDGHLDLIAAGGREPDGTPWTTVPVAASAGRTGFTVTNDAVAGLTALATQPGPSVLSGDFDGDGLFDVALVGAASVGSVPVALANGDGSSRFVAYEAPAFLAALSSGARGVSGDFDGDGRWDLALVGGSTADAIVVAFASAGSSFRTVTLPAPSLSTAVPAGSLVVTGDFDGDGHDDLAFAGAVGATSVVLVLARATSFVVQVVPAAEFAVFAAHSTDLVSFDADGDGCSDLAVVGGTDTTGAAWTTVPVAFSTGRSSFRVTTETVRDFPLYATQGSVAVSASAAHR